MPVPLILLAIGAGFTVGGAAALLAPDLLRSRRPGLLRLVAAVAAIVAAASEAAPTGVALVDVAFRGLAAAAVVLVSMRARPRSVLTSAAILASATIAWGGSVIAVFTLGMALAHVLTARRGRLASAVLAMGVVTAAFRLDGPASVGAPTAIAVAACAPMMVAGLLRMRDGQRRLVLVALAATGAFVAVNGAAAAATAWSARPDLERGVSEAAAGIEAARRGDPEEASARLSAAQRSFDEGGRAVSAWWTRPASLVPVVSQHLASLRIVARTGSELSATGAETAADAELRGLQVQSGSVDVARLAALRGSLRRAARTVTSASDALAGARSPWLVKPVAEPIDEQLARLARASRDASTAAAALDVLPGLLGAEGRRTYFLAVQSPAELRGAGGIIGSYGVVAAEQGTVRVEEFGSDGDLNRGGNPAARVLHAPTDYVARHGANHPERLWQNVTLAPDFPTVATVIADLYPQSGGRPVDGVLSMDPAALAAVLRLIGPVEVAPWPVPISAENVESILLFEQYARLPVEPRKVFLSDVAETVARKFTSVDLPAPKQIVDALAPAVAGHHLMITSARPAEQSFLARIGATGALPSAPDNLAVVSQNAGGNKIDWFLRRRCSYDVSVDAATRRIEADVTVELVNEAPAKGLPDYIIGSLARPPDLPGVNRQLLSVYSPWAAQGMTVDGRAVVFASEVESGRNVYTVDVSVPPGATTRVELQLRGHLPARPYELVVHRQPLAAAETLAVTLDGQARRPAGPFLADVRVVGSTTSS